MSTIEPGAAGKPARRISAGRGERQEKMPDCLAAKFGRHKELTAREIDFLRTLEAEETSLPAGHELISQGEPSENLYVLRSGWAYGHKLLANGRRQVLEILLPGDLLGTREFVFHGALNSVTTATASVVCPFPRARLNEFYEDHPQLTALLVDMLLREQALLVERIADIGSRPALQRLAHLFVEIHVRLCRTGPDPGRSFDFPLSQTILGEALGLSRVHVARTLKELREAGLLELSRRRATILDAKALIRAAEFDEFYLAKL